MNTTHWKVFVGFFIAVIAGCFVEGAGMAIAAQMGNSLRVQKVSSIDTSAADRDGADVSTDVQIFASVADNAWPIPNRKVIIRPPYKPDKTGSPFVDVPDSLPRDGSANSQFIY